MDVEPRPSIDRIRVHPAALQGEVRPPGDKSISHRALILAALTEEGARVDGVAPSGDVLRTAACLEALGASVEIAPGGTHGQLVGRVAGPLREPDRVLDAGNSGTSLRLLAGVLATIDGVSVMTGDDSLRRRPVDRVLEPLRRMGADVDARADGRLPPMVVRGGALRGIMFESRVASAQVKSCVLLAGLAAEGDTTIISPMPSRDHTERMLAYLGGRVTASSDDGRERVTLRPGQLSGRDLSVPADPSSAAFWLVAAVLGGGGPVTTRRICVNPGRLGSVTVLRRMGGDVSVGTTAWAGGEPVADVTATPSELSGAEVSGAEVVTAIDELPILSLAGAMSRDGLVVEDAGELRVKESDRIRVLRETLAALGVEVEERPDGYRVRGGQRPDGGVVDAAGDHRMAMTACVAGIVGTSPVEVRGFSAVATSYPTFLDDLEQLGGRVERLEL